MRLTWYTEDGYVGKRPHQVEIPDDEIEECETQEQFDELVESYVQESFNERVSFSYEQVKLKKNA